MCLTRAYLREEDLPARRMLSIYFSGELHRSLLGARRTRKLSGIPHREGDLLFVDQGFRGEMPSPADFVPPESYFMVRYASSSVIDRFEFARLSECTLRGI